MWGNKSIVFLVIIILFLLGVNNPAFAREITVDDNNSGADFKRIQEAVNSSSPGDLILVYPGYYNESVDVVIQNITVLSKPENPENATVRAFKLGTSNITLNGFTIQETVLLQSYMGELSHNKIENCTVKNNILELGILADECYNSSIDKNVIQNSGISIMGPDEVSNFTVSDNLLIKGGIAVSHGPFNCILRNNTILDGGIGVASSVGGSEILGNYISGSGISFYETSGNYIANNTLVNCTHGGILLTWLTGTNIVHNNTIKNSDYGILVEDSGGNKFSNNTISENTVGILLGGLTISQAGANSLLNNTISKNGIGISLEGDSYENLIANNKVELNRQYGVYIKQTSSEMPYYGTNRFFNNVFNNTINFFNNTSGHTGNYYIANAANISSTTNFIALNATRTSNTSISSNSSNIIGGPYLGGNSWAKPDGTGFSQNCNDWNKDGIGDSIYTASAYDIDYLPLVPISKQNQPIFPVADFNVNVTGGYVPVSVQFADFSQNATSRRWDFDNDGITDSSDETAVYTYPLSRIYTANLTVSNENGTSSKLYPIRVSDRPQYIFTEAQITTDKSNQAMPDIHGDKIVYLDNRNGLGYYSDIYMYDLSTSRETKLTPSSSYFDYNSEPSIYGDKIVWQEPQYNNSINGRDKFDIHMYNTSASRTTQITNSGKAGDPDIYEDRIVYVDARNGNADIYMYNLSTSNETQITRNESWQGDPAIYGDIIIWQDSRNGGNYRPPDIYMYNLSTSTEIQITAGTSDQYSPAEIFGDKIAWTDSRNGNRDIYLYNLSSSKEFRITIDGSNHYSPNIYGDRIVWADDRNRNGDIYMYNLSTHTETRITINKSSQQSPAIYGDRIVWTDGRNEYKIDGHPETINEDIYMCTVAALEPSLKRPVADFFANRTSGKAPLKVSFTDNSKGSPVFWFWDFGDGINSKHALNATHTFIQPGKYDVSLTVTNENGSNTRIIPSYITVTESKKT